MSSLTAECRGTIGPMSLFRPAARYPADPRAVFILMLSVFVGITALAVETAPDTLEALLPPWGVTVWDTLLMVGSAITLIGMARHTENGVILEQIGSVTVGVATIFYAVLSIKVIGTKDLESVGIVLAWGIACLIRWVQLQMLLRQEYRRKIHHEVRNAVLRSANRPEED